jgi:predicted  nucleic acid-binding Zn-ribbon protein
MTKDEQITSLKDEVEGLKKQLADALKEIANQKTIIKECDDKISELNETIETLAAAPADAQPAAAASALEFKHENELYQIDEHPDRELIIPGIGPLTVKNIVSNVEALAHLVKVGSDLIKKL